MFCWAKGVKFTGNFVTSQVTMGLHVFLVGYLGNFWLMKYNIVEIHFKSSLDFETHLLTDGMSFYIPSVNW